MTTIGWLAPTVAFETWDATVTGMHDPEGKPMPPFKHIVTIVLTKKDGQWLAAVVRPMAPLPMTPPPAH